MVDFGILNKKPETPVEVLDNLEAGAFEMATPDPFDLDRLKLALVPFEKEVAKMVETAQELVITDAESNELAATYGNQAQTLLKRITTEATEIKGPYAKIVNGINAVIKPFRDDLAGIKQNIGSKISAYARQQAEHARRVAEKKAKAERERLKAKAEKERQAEIERQEQERERAKALQRELDKKAEAENVEPVKVDIPEVVDPGTAPIVETTVPDPKKPIKTEAGTTSIVEKWNYKVLNVDKLPEKYVVKQPDHKAIKEAIDAGVRDIPGARIFPDDTVRFRASK